MSATNHTPNYSLPQFIGTDVPTWLVDVNGAFSDIDTAIKNAADAAGSVAGDVTALENRVGTVETNLTATNQSLGTLNTTVQQQGGSIAANTAKIGTATLQTDAQNLSGAINELLAGETPQDASGNFASNYVNFNHADHSVIIDTVGNLTICELILNTNSALPNNSTFASGLPIPLSHYVEVLAWTTSATPVIIPMQITRQGMLYNRNTNVPVNTTFRLTACYLSE